MRAEHDRRRPLAGAAPNVTGSDIHDSTPVTISPGDLDAWCESLRGRFVVEVGIGDGTRARTFWYSNVRAAERCVDRAHARGQVARVALVKTLPVGIIGGLGGLR